MELLEIQDQTPPLLTKNKSQSYLSMLKNESFGPMTAKQLSPESK
jgi:hypothetical protein